MSLGSFFRMLFGGNNENPSHNRGMDGDRPHHGHEGRYHGDGPDEERHGRGPVATDTVTHNAVEAASYSRKAEIKNETETVEGPKKIQKRRRDE